MANGRAQVFQVAAGSTGVAADFDVLFAGRSRDFREHTATPKRVQARYASLEFLSIRLMIAAVGEIDR